jgi:predicted dehydrogenase
MKKEIMEIGVIGAGGIGRIHLQALQNLGIEAVAIADPSPAALDAASPLAPKARHFKDWRDLLAVEEIEAVTIGTLNSLHFEVFRAAIVAGKHVFCEKTLTADEHEAREAEKLRLKPGQIAQVGYMKRFFPASVQAKQWMAEIGRPLCASVHSFQGGWRGEEIFDDPDWRPSNGSASKTKMYASGGMLNMAGSHMLDMTRWLLGEPASVTAENWSPNGYDVELHSHALFKMRSGTLVHFEAALSNFSKTGAYENGWDEFIQITGTKGKIELFYPVWNRPTEHPARARLYRESDKTWLEPVFAKVNPFELELGAFVKNCQGQSVEAPGLQDGVQIDLWIAACYESAHSGSRVAFQGIGAG